MVQWCGAILAPRSSFVSLLPKHIQILHQVRGLSYKHAIICLLLRTLNNKRQIVISITNASLGSEPPGKMRELFAIYNSHEELEVSPTAPPPQLMQWRSI